MKKSYIQEHNPDEINYARLFRSLRQKTIEIPWWIRFVDVKQDLPKLLLKFTINLDGSILYIKLLSHYVGFYNTGTAIKEKMNKVLKEIIPIDYDIQWDNNFITVTPNLEIAAALNEKIKNFRKLLNTEDGRKLLVTYAIENSPIPASIQDFFENKTVIAEHTESQIKHAREVSLINRVKHGKISVPTWFKYLLPNNSNITQFVIKHDNMHYDIILDDESKRARIRLKSIKPDRSINNLKNIIRKYLDINQDFKIIDHHLDTDLIHSNSIIPTCESRDLYDIIKYKMEPFSTQCSRNLQKVLKSAAEENAKKILKEHTKQEIENARAKSLEKKLDQGLIEKAPSWCKWLLSDDQIAATFKIPFPKSNDNLYLTVHPDKSCKVELGRHGHAFLNFTEEFLNSVKKTFKVNGNIHLSCGTYECELPDLYPYIIDQLGPLSPLLNDPKNRGLLIQMRQEDESDIINEHTKEEIEKSRIITLSKQILDGKYIVPSWCKYLERHTDGNEIKFTLPTKYDFNSFLIEITLPQDSTAAEIKTPLFRITAESITSITEKIMKEFNLPSLTYQRPEGYARIVSEQLYKHIVDELGRLRILLNTANGRMLLRSWAKS